MRRAVGLGLVAVAVTFAVGAPAASAAKIKTQVVFEGSVGTTEGQVIFYGFVDSARKKCERGRRVDLFFDLKSPVADQKVGSAIAQANGRWALYRSPDGLNAGYYYAKVRGARVGGDFCKGDRSPLLLIT